MAAQTSPSDRVARWPRCWSPRSSRRRPAQQDQPTEFQSWRIPGWTFTPGVTVGALYDTNVTLSSPDVNGSPVGQAARSSSRSASSSFFSPRTTFSGGYQGSLRRYVDLGGLDGTDHRGLLVAARAGCRGG